MLRETYLPIYVANWKYVEFIKAVTTVRIISPRRISEMDAISCFD